jgi:hypothetical protein
METLSKWNINVQPQLRYDTSTIKVFIILWHFLEVIYTFNNSLIIATATFSYATYYHVSEVLSTGM